MCTSLPILKRRSLRAWGFAVALAFGFITPERGYAQYDTLRGTNPTKADSIAAIAAWVTSDTGRMMPGYRDLSRYDNPGMCFVAIRGMQDAIWRRNQSDTFPQRTPSDTIPTAARDIGRTCLAKLTPQGVDSAELYDLMAAAIKVGDTALARSTMLYYASKVTRSVRERGFVFVDAMELALTSHPTQRAWAESLFPLVVALGADGLDPLKEAFQLRWTDAHLRFDTAAFVRIGIDRDTIFRSLIAAGAIQDSTQLGPIFNDSMVLVRLHRNPDYLETMRRLGDRYVAMWSSSDAGRMGAEGEVDVTLGTAKILGTPAPPPFTMFRHYPATAPTGPVRGRVTIVVYPERLGQGFIEPHLATLRRLHEKYHDRGLDIMLVAQTQGFAWGSPPLDSAAEAKLIGWYYREHLKLPFTVFVTPAEFERLSDGRFKRNPSKSIPKIGVHRYWRPWWGYIVARDGTIAGHINRTEMAHEREAMIEAHVRRELDIQTRAGQ